MADLDVVKKNHLKEAVSAPLAETKTVPLATSYHTYPIIKTNQAF